MLFNSCASQTESFENGSFKYSELIVSLQNSKKIIRGNKRVIITRNVPVLSKWIYW